MIFGLIARIISFLGSSLFFLFLLAYSFIYLSSAVFYGLLFAFLFSSIIIFVLRLFFRGRRRNLKGFESKLLQSGKFSKSKIGLLRRRIAEVEKRSFASSHVARISGFSVILYFNAYPMDTVVFLLITSVVVGFARVYLKRHTRLDVLTGLIVGVLSGYLAFSFLALL
jgi:membrane-associated phospholipid phosphatase